MRPQNMWNHDVLAKAMHAIRAGGLTADMEHKLAMQFVMGGMAQKGQELESKRIAEVQEFTVAGDFPTPTAIVQEKFTELPDLDLGWRNIFVERDYTQVRTKSFSLRTLGSGLTFRKVTPLDSIEIQKVSGTELIVMMDRYAGSIGYDWSWFEDNDWYAVEDQTRDLISKSFDVQAAVIYGLLSASRADSDVAFQGSGATVTRDIDTINFAGDAILSSLKDKGMDVVGNPNLVVVAPLELRTRLLHAIRTGYLTTASASGGPTELTHSIQLVLTSKLTNQAGTAPLTDQYFVCLPGRKNVVGQRQRLAVFESQDILNATTNVAGHIRFGGAVGEPDQSRRCASS